MTLGASVAVVETSAGAFLSSGTGANMVAMSVEKEEEGQAESKTRGLMRLTSHHSRIPDLCHSAFHKGPTLRAFLFLHVRDIGVIGLRSM